MNVEHIWAVRDARRLNYKEKTFLFVLISRGEEGLYSKWKRNAEDMGMSKDVYYRTRDSLSENGIITVVRRMDSSTIYTFSPEALSLYENAHSLYENNHSLYENSHSQNPETKENTKKNMKENLEGELELSTAGAVSSLSNLEVKEEFNSILRATKWTPFSNEEEEASEDSLYENESVVRTDVVEESQIETGLPDSPYRYKGVLYGTKAMAARARLADTKTVEDW